MPSSAQQSLATIEAFLQRVGAMTKRAEAMSEPGSIGGSTTHPVKDVDDRLFPVREGKFSKEKQKDLKEDQGPASVENAEEASAKEAAWRKLWRKQAERLVSEPGSASDDAEESKLTVAPTGEDPDNETESAKPGKDDPGSDHPARTDNDELDGHKYASAPLEKLAEEMKRLGEDICAQIAWMTNPSLVGADKYANDQQLAAQAGWEMAGLLDGSLDKRAADAVVVESIAQVIKTAQEDADRTAGFIHQQLQNAEMPKQEQDEGHHGEGEIIDDQELEDLVDSLSPEEAEALLHELTTSEQGNAGDAQAQAQEELLLDELARQEQDKQAFDQMASELAVGQAAVEQLAYLDKLAEEALTEELSQGAGGDEVAQAEQLAQVLEQMGVTPDELAAAMEDDSANLSGDEMAALAQEAPLGEKAAQMRRYISEVIGRSRR